MLDGDWHLTTSEGRATLTLIDGKGDLIEERPGAKAERAEVLGCDTSSGEVRLSAKAGAIYRHMLVQITGSTMAGRYAESTQAQPPPLDRHERHMTGWNSQRVDRETDARVFALSGPRGLRAVLRVASPNAGAEASFKAYAGPDGELEEWPASVTSWDDHELSVTIRRENARYTLRGRLSGRKLQGTLVGWAPGDLALSGERAEVLTRPVTGRHDIVWERRTRAALRQLVMAGTTIENLKAVQLGAPMPPFSRPRLGPPSGRDDGASGDDAYDRRELTVSATIATSRDGARAERTMHGWFSVPRAAPPQSGYPLVVVLNGHAVLTPHASGLDTFNAEAPEYWYGDAFARRGYVVVAVDIGHRPATDQSLYRDNPANGDTACKNGPHPSVKLAPFADSDLEEDGERVLDAQIALAAMQASPLPIERARTAIVGLSLGAEVALYTAALDQRFTAVVAAGYGPDLHVLATRANHPCYRWQHAELTEYISVSDLVALCAERTVVFETGLRDQEFSSRSLAPFASAKQIIYRAKSTFAGTKGRLVHVVHPGSHSLVTGVTTGGLRSPLRNHPDESSPLGWQTDETTVSTGSSLFDILAMPPATRSVDGG